MAQTVEKPRIRNSSGQYAARGMITGKLLRRAWGLGQTALPQPSMFSNDRPNVVRFNSEFSSENVDTVNGVIRGVSVITSGLIARGHDLEVDDTTLSQMKLCADTKGQVPVKVDHKSGAGAVCGFLTNFRQDGNKLKADWHLLHSHPQKEQILETAQRMPRGVGLSAAFVGPEKAERARSGRNAARCAELISVDYVTLPAANPDGMFAARVDSQSDAMTPDQIAALNEALKQALAPITEKIEAQAKQINLLTNPPTIEDLAQMTPEQLAEYGLTPEDVQSVLEEVEAEQAEQTEQTEQTDASVQTEGAATEGAEAAAGATGAVGAALAALTKEVTALSARFKAQDEAVEQAKTETLFSEIEGKVDALAKENASLREALKSGGKPSKPGVTTEFASKHGTCEFEKLVQLGVSEKKLTKAKAFEFARTENPKAYQGYLVRLGVLKGEQE